MHLPSNGSADHIHDEPLGFVFFFGSKTKSKKIQNLLKKMIERYMHALDCLFSFARIWKIIHPAPPAGEI